MKYTILTVLLLVASRAFGQACTNPNDGSGNVCAPTASANAKWMLINHASDIGSADQGCFLYKQVNFATNNLTITMTHPGTAPTCSETGRTQTSQPYLSGALITQQSFSPSTSCPSGTCTIQASIKAGKGWPAFWLLGGNGLTSSSSGCQFQTAFNGWDNNGNCNWSQDTMPNGDSGEIDIMEYVEPTYTDTNQNLFANASTNFGSSQNISDASANFHTYTLHWSNSSLTYAVDGTASSTHWSSNVPRNPMFIILENRVQGPSGKVPGSFPQVMAVQYVQVCDGKSCTLPGAAGGNSVFFDDFTEAPATPSAPTELRGTVH